VRSLVAVQAQDYAAGLWAVGQRIAEPSRIAVERALAERTLVRTWPMRGTLHTVLAEDARWLLGLLAPRILKRGAARYRELSIDAKVLGKARTLFEKHLAGGTTLTRPELYAHLARAKIDPADQRGIHILGALAMERVICFGAHRDKQPTFALLDEWITSSRELAGDEAIAEVTRRYFLGHGPATVDDLAWWTGFNRTEARRAVELVRGELAATTIGDATYYSGPLTVAKAGTAHLLSAWDELTVGYRDRTASVDAEHATASQNGLSWCASVDGKVVGLWRRDKGKVSIHPFGKLAPAATKALARATERYERYASS
jgi:Winged helix DNA-binding domain